MENKKFQEIINKKLQNKTLSKDEIFFIISGYLKNTLTENLMISFLKTIAEKGMNNDEIYFLTKAMQELGETLDLSELGTVADKHSTGGVSDSTTFLIVPIVASLGVKILKMSGKSLGFTGGTADKILCFKGLKNDIEIERALEITKQANGCFITQSDKIAPADKKIYELLDRIVLIENIPLIASSILSKKLASGSDIIILDIKFGDGAFMKNKKSAEELANIMVEILKREGKKVCAVLTSMQEPLGDFIGDELEILESISILKNLRKNNLLILSEFLSALIVEKAKNISFNQAMLQVQESVKSGKAFAKFKEIIKAQGGDLMLFDKDLKSFKSIVIKAKTEGFIKKIGTKKLGFLTRCYKEKYACFAGVEIKARVGEKVGQNNQVIKLFFNTKDFKKLNDKNLTEIIESYEKCFEISESKVKQKHKLIEKIIS